MSETARVNIVFRVDKEVRNKLKKIAFDREMAGKPLSSQQDILEKLVKDFIKKEGKDG